MNMQTETERTKGDKGFIHREWQREENTAGFPYFLLNVHSHRKRKNSIQVDKECVWKTTVIYLRCKWTQLDFLHLDWRIRSVFITVNGTTNIDPADNADLSLFHIWIMNGTCISVMIAQRVCVAFMLDVHIFLMTSGKMEDCSSRGFQWRYFDVEHFGCNSPKILYRC